MFKDQEEVDQNIYIENLEEFQQNVWKNNLSQMKLAEEAILYVFRKERIVHKILKKENNN